MCKQARQNRLYARCAKQQVQSAAGKRINKPISSLNTILLRFYKHAAQANKTTSPDARDRLPEEDISAYFYIWSYNLQPATCTQKKIRPISLSGFLLQQQPNLKTTNVLYDALATILFCSISLRRFISA